jgi:hypothetical protein
VWKSIIRKIGGTSGLYIIKIVQTDYEDHVTIENLSLQTTRTELDRGLYISYPELDILWNRSQTRCRIQDVEVCGHLVTASGHSVGIHLVNCHNAEITTTSVQGRAGPETGGGGTYRLPADWTKMDVAFLSEHAGATYAQASPTDIYFSDC